MQATAIDLTLSDDEDVVIAQLDAAPRVAARPPPPRPAQPQSNPPQGRLNRASGTAAQPKLLDSDGDDEFDVGFMQNPSSQVELPASSGAGVTRVPGTTAYPAQPPLAHRHSSSGQPTSAQPSYQQPPSRHQPPANRSRDQDADQDNYHMDVDDDEYDPAGDDGVDSDFDLPARGPTVRPYVPRGNTTAAGGGGGGEASGAWAGGVEGADEVLKPDAFMAAVAAAGDKEGAAAAADGCSCREVARRRKAAEQRETKLLKERFKAFEKQLKEQAKVDKKARTAELREAKRAQQAADKAAGRGTKEVQRALQGGPVDPSKFMTLRVSVRLMELPWADALITLLRDNKFQYKVDAAMPLSTEYAFVRWTRRVTPHVAAALLAAQEQDAGERRGNAAALQPLDTPGSEQPDASGEVQLLFPLIMLFMEPKAFIDNLIVQGGGLASQGAGHSGGGGGGGGGDGLCGGGSRGMGVACLPDAQFPKLRRLRSAFSGAYPDASLTVCCVGLAKELQAKERSDSWFNAQVVRDELLDLQWSFPAIRLREDLVDGAQAAELLITTTNCLGKHHKKQQEGYLTSFNQSRVRTRDIADGDSLTASRRVLTVALGHLMPQAKAQEVTRSHPSLAALLDLLQDDTRPATQRQAALMTMPGQRAATIGKQTAKNVFDFFNQRDGNASCGQA